MEFGKAKKSGSPRKAPKVAIPNHKKNYMNENDKGNSRKSPMGPLMKKRLSK